MEKNSFLAAFLSAMLTGCVMTRAVVDEGEDTAKFTTLVFTVPFAHVEEGSGAMKYSYDGEGEWVLTIGGQASGVSGGEIPAEVLAAVGKVASLHGPAEALAILRGYLEARPPP